MWPMSYRGLIDVEATSCVYWVYTMLIYNTAKLNHDAQHGFTRRKYVYLKTSLIVKALMDRALSCKHPEESVIF